MALVSLRGLHHRTTVTRVAHTWHVTTLNHPGPLRVELDDLSREEVRHLVAEHLTDMHATSPADSVHALDEAGLRSADVTFWTIWDAADLLGCGALKQLSPTGA